MASDTVVVVAGGAVAARGRDNERCRGQSLTTRIAATTARAVVAADSGVDLALELGLRIDVAVGDFDSISPAGLAAIEAGSTRVVRHRAEKDETDLELALDEAAALGPRRILVVGVASGRLDHLLAGALALCAERYAAFEVDALLGDARIVVVRGERLLEGRPGELVSLLSLHGPAEGVVTDGLVYPLRGETLQSGSSRGVSNVFAASNAKVSLEHGVLLAVCPGGEER